MSQSPEIRHISLSICDINPHGGEYIILGTGGGLMEQVLYADILFFVNFSMDFVTLYITSRLTSSPFSGVRGTVAAVLGGLFATIITVTGSDGLFSVASTGIISLIMVRISFKKSAVPILIRRGAVFWGSGALLGGVMTVICSLGNGESVPDTGAGAASLLFLASALSLLSVRAFSHLKRRNTVLVKVTLEGYTVKFTALADSGNLLTDPLSSKPVILADRSLFGNIPVPEIGHIPDSLRKRVRMIPIKGVSDSTLLPGFVPDSAFVITDKGERQVDAVIAVTDLGKSHFGGYGANAPAELL